MLGLRHSDTSSSWCRWWLGWRRHARVDKPFCGKSLDLQFQSFTIVLLTTYLYWIKGILRGYAILSGSQRPGRTVRPAAADFPRDVCLTVSRNHAVFLFYVYGGMNRSRQVVASFFSFDTLTGDLKTLPSPDFVRIGCTLASVEHRLILMRPGKSELRVFDTITEEWVETALVGFQEPTKGGFDVVSATGCIIPVLFKEPMLLFLGGYILSAIEAEEPSNFFVHLDFYRGKMQGQIVPLPELNHNVTQPLCVTILIPSFRLEAMRNEITDGTQE